jgi:hypothetical protein
MTFIYATGSPQSMAFYLAQLGDAIPKGAVVYAVCDGERCANHLDEYTCRAMTDAEHYEFLALIRQASKLETERLRHTRAANPFRRLYSWYKDRIATPVVNLGDLAKQASPSYERKA